MTLNPIESLLAELVRIDSTNPSLREGAPGEGALARHLARRLEAAGLAVDLHDVVPGRPNVVGRLPGSGGGPSLLLFGHLDTVAAAWPGAYEPVVRDGRMYGRGAADCKAGLAASLMAVDRLAAAAAAGDRLRGDVLYAGVMDEEWASLGAEALLGQARPDAAILAECSDLAVVDAHGGFAWFEVESRGVEAAGVAADRGVDAIALLGPVLSGITALDADLAARPPAAYGRGSIHASTVAGGDQFPVYPKECRLTVERCLIHGETVAQAEAELQALLDAARAADPRFAAAARTVVAREAARVGGDEPVLAALAAATTEVLGAPAPRQGDLGWGDSGLLIEAGIPCPTFGPSGRGEHTAEESVDLASVERCADVLEAAVRRFCA